MGHGHGHGGHGHAHGSSSHAPDASGRRTLTIVLGLTLTFFVAELAVGLFSGSLALLADAGHMLNDSFALLVSLVAAQVALRPRSSTKTYGYRRAEVLGAQMSSLLLLAVAGGIFVEAIERLSRPPAVQGTSALVTAVAGLAVNLLAAFLLASRGGSGLHVKSALAHVLGDALGSIAAIASNALILAFGWYLADPIASMAICVLIAFGGLRLLRQTMHVLMEGVPEGVDVVAVEETIRTTKGVASVHDLHVWSLTPGEPMLSAHVVVARGEHGIEVAQRVGAALREKHAIVHATIQPEPPEAELVALRTRR